MKIQEAIGNLENAVKNNEFKLGILTEAIDGLNSTQDIITYFQVYEGFVKDALKKDIYEGVSNDAVESIKSGKPINSIAHDLAIDRFTYVLGKYRNPAIHQCWKQAIPEIYPDGRLPNILGF